MGNKRRTGETREGRLGGEVGNKRTGETREGRGEE